MLVALLKPDLDSIAVSLFVHDLVEFDKYCIRQQDPHIYYDTEARCPSILTLRNLVLSRAQFSVRGNFLV